MPLSTTSLLAPTLARRARGDRRDPSGSRLGHRRTTSGLLRPQPGSAPLRGADAAPTPIWGYDGTVPGPLLRVKRGAEIKVRLTNGLAEPTSVHWHGVRIANAMDGAAPADAEAGRARPELRLPFQGARRRHVLVPPARQRRAPARPRALWPPDRGRTRAGRGRPRRGPGARRLAALGARRGGDRGRTARPTSPSTARLRSTSRSKPTSGCACACINATGARMMAIRIDRHSARVMAIDGQPAEPFIARDSRVAFGPGNRIDFFLDAALPAGAVAPIVLETDKGAGAARAARLRGRRTGAAGSPARSQAAARQSAARAHGFPRRSSGSTSAARSAEPPAADGSGKPLFSVKRGRTVMLGLVNKTALAAQRAPARPPFPAARPARRWLEAVLARYRSWCRRWTRGASRSSPTTRASGSFEARRWSTRTSACGGLVRGDCRAPLDRQALPKLPEQPPINSRQHLRQVLGDQPGPGFVAASRRAARPLRSQHRRRACPAPAGRRRSRRARRRIRRSQARAARCRQSTRGRPARRRPCPGL